MQSSAPLPKVAFFHVMKTGGMTFRQTLRTIYGSSFRLSDPNSFEDMENDLQRCDCVEFHMMPRRDHWIHAHRDLVRGRRWDLLEGRESFTMLREPVDQFVSQYYYMVQQRASIEPVMNARGSAFPESILSVGSYNEQVGFLAAKSLEMGSFVDRSDLELAKELLVSGRVHVGLTERFADSMNVFEMVTGLAIPGAAIQIQNRNSHRKPVDALTGFVRDCLRERNLLDFELYEFGKELFLEDLARFKPRREYSFLPQDETVPSAAAVPRAAEAVGETPDITTVVLDVAMTRGSSYRRQLAHMFGMSYHFCDDPSIEAIEAQLAAYGCVEFSAAQHSGDFVPMHQAIATQNRWDLLEGKHVFTMLREPVEYFLSRYALMARVRSFLEPYYVAKGLAFPKNFDEYLEMAGCGNHQLRFLQGWRSIAESENMGRADVEAMKSVFVRLGVHVGLTERFDDSLRVLQAVTGRPLLADVPNLDPAPAFPAIESFPAETIKRIEEVNALDLELYEFGRGLFSADLERYGLDRVQNPEMREPNAQKAGLVASVQSIFGRDAAR